MGCDARGAATAPPLSGSLSEAAMQAGNATVVVLVPSDDVVDIQADLPARTTGRWQLAVPYAIEEQLAENIEDMHVAVGERGDAGQRVPVSVIARARLQEYLDALQAAGLKVGAMYAESALLPPNPGQVVGLLLGDSLQIRTPEGSHCTVPADPLGAAFDIACAGDATQRSLLLYATPADWQSRSDSVDALRARFLTVKVQLLPQGPMPLFAQQLPQAQPINLLQGDYEPEGVSRAGWREWRLPAALAAVLLLLVAGGLWFQGSRIKAAEQQLDARLTELGRSLLADAAPADPVQLRRAVMARLSGSNSDDVALELMTALANARVAAPRARVESLRYQNGALELRIRADNADSLEQINAQLRSGGWRAELLSGAAAGDGYAGQIRISRGSAS
jgi:general secretion pathway protein L